MKNCLLIAACALVSLCIVARPAMAASNGFVEVKKPFVNIYEYLDPKSNIIKTANKGDLYELVYAGTSWYQVKVKDKVGWLERRSGDIVDAPKFLFYSIPFGTFALFVVLLIVTLAGVSFLIYRQKSAEL